MSARGRFAPQRRQRGVAAIELAFISVMIFSLLPFVFWFGRVFYEYSVVLKAGHQAARYVASLPALEIGSLPISTTAMATARQMVLDASAGAGIDLTLVPTGFECKPHLCGSAGEVPATVHLWFSVTLTEDMFPYFTQTLLGDASSVEFDIDITAPYAG